MRFTSFTIAALILLPLEAAIRFTEPRWMPDLGISCPVLDGAAEPAELPRAESYLVSSGGETRLEDRFSVNDLWLTLTVRGKWRDPFGNRFEIARLSFPPPNRGPDAASTRANFYASLKNPIKPGAIGAATIAAFAAAPSLLDPHPETPRRSHTKNHAALRIFRSAEGGGISCLFRPKTPERDESPDWYLATLHFAAGHSESEARASLHDNFLARISIPPKRSRPSPIVPTVPPDLESLSDPDLLALEMHRSVANYTEWNFTEAQDLAMIDNLDSASRAALIGPLTNNLPLYRREYAARIPSPLASATNAIAAVRIFDSHEKYIQYVGEAHRWTAAVWDPIHRELVLHLTELGTEHLLRTVWHEAFHQYLSCAGATLPAAPWFNEGHAELFENSSFKTDPRTKAQRIVFDESAEAALFVNNYAAELVEMLPDLMQMDYDEFYSGSDADRRLKYRLAWSIAYFLETGAPKLRFRPFENLRSGYVQNLVSSRNMHEATALTLDEKRRDEFIAAWLAFWTKR